MSAGELVGMCFEIRNAAHKAHLKTPSYSQHKALDDFYNEIIVLADGLAESWQGRTGALIEDYAKANISDDPEKILEVLKKGREWIDTNRQSVSEHSEIQNQIDEILTLFNSTIYKLVFLK